MVHEVFLCCPNQLTSALRFFRMQMSKKKKRCFYPNSTLFLKVSYNCGWMMHICALHFQTMKHEIAENIPEGISPI